jgi:hypothetical protein
VNFFELKRGTPFYFNHDPDKTVFYSAGMDGAYGRYVDAENKVWTFNQWAFCGPLDQVTSLSSDEPSTAKEPANTK